MSVLQLAAGVFIALTLRDVFNTGSSLLVSWLNARRYRALLEETAEELYKFDKPKVKASKPKGKG
jgi:hypothetical protein